MATIGHYSVYAALLQTTVEGPEFADGASDVPVESVETADKAEYDGWIKIQRKRACSDGSLPNRQNLDRKSVV